MALMAEQGKWPTCSPGPHTRPRAAALLGCQEPDPQDKDQVGAHIWEWNSAPQGSTRSVTTEQDTERTTHPPPTPSEILEP